MLQLTWAQLRAHTGRLVASGLAVVIAVAFVVATLTLNASTRASMLQAVGAQYVGSDVVVRFDPTAAAPVEELSTGDGTDGATAPGEDPQAQALRSAAARLQALPGTAALSLDTSAHSTARIEGRQGSHFVAVESVAAPGPLRWQRTSSGRLPERAGEVAVSERTGAAVGTTIVLDVPGPVEEAPDGGTTQGTRPHELRVVGVVDLRGDPSAGLGGRLFALEPDVRTAGGTPDAVRLTAAAGTDPDRVRVEAARALAGAPVTVLSGEETAEEIAAAYTGEAAGLAAVLLSFAAVAVVVAGLVIANTFAVLLAQRTRELALLRCVGAHSRQVRRGVLAEAAAMGLVASVLGIAGGIGLAAVVSAVVAGTDSPIPLGTVVVPPSAVGIGLLLGVGVTVVSALLPARAATRVSPLAALRPLDPAPLRSGGGLLRLVAGLLLFLPSTAALLLFAAVGQLVPAVGAGLGSFLGVLLLAQRAVPPVVALAGRLVGPVGGVPGRLAAGNALRNPRRTAATATALLIGVTLTTTMVVGASSTRATADGQLDAMYPADVVVESPEGLPGGLLERVRAVDGVDAAAAVLRGDVTGGPFEGWTAYGVEAAEVAPVLRSPAGAPQPEPGVAVLSRQAAKLVDVRDGGTVSAGSPAREFRVRIDPETETFLVLTAADLRGLDPDATPAALWVRLDDGLDAQAQTELVIELESLVGTADPGAIVHGVVTERAALDGVLTTMLLVVTGLLAVAVVIALIGVGNTLALSVVERRQESGLLRALGLTRRQLRATLAWEAVLVSGVAAVLGVALGTAYGLLGTTSVFGLSGEVVLDVPWLQVGGVVVAATAAGVLSSVLPARRAARVSPVVALAA
ncbi:putative ABC transport system permease protein [Kineococcus xinjiangensis]|uniref:Putative ABC transport system permease protein n=1 Tax=Kineococcus xinjiangensis TaxID=512762 RepID=A0A2S6IWP3_9ACTN|nr:FtsX-like permease family protein [Kineococcus xinjiangensis]PPK98581.1 putative ABC transport system permease protein [Kineococcus xinjiangensis]